MPSACEPDTYLVVGEDSAAPEWVGPLCQIALNWKKGDRSIVQHFGNASPDLSDKRFPALVRAYLSHHPALINAWQGYSEDKRTSPSPYLDRRPVGFFEGVEWERAAPGRAPVSRSGYRVCRLHIPRGALGLGETTALASQSRPSHRVPPQCRPKCALTATSVLRWLRFRGSD